MDFLPDLAALSSWILEHGSFILFLLLALGIIAFPIPEETLILTVGFLVYQGKLSLPTTVAAACLGSMFGISISYLIGRSIGLFFITKYGKWLGITNNHLQKAHDWSERFGKWALFFGYFIPGIRHFTGLLAGATKLSVQQFALFAYSGAIFWVSLFISIGYLLGFFGLSLYEKRDTIAHVVLLIALALLGLVAIGITTRYALKASKNILNDPS